MAKKQNKKKNNNSKKRKIIVGVVCGVFVAAAIGTGLGIGLTKCSGPTQPTNKFAIYFTPAPGDTGVQISTRVKYIDFGQTFAAVKDDVTATKKTAEGEWQFQWWYKDGDEPTRRMSDDIVIGNDPQVKSITLHPYFAEPLAKHTVIFSNDGDPTITITGDSLECEVDYGTKLEEIIRSHKIKVAIIRGDEKWDFKYWSADGLVPDPDTPWKKPRNFDFSTEITTDVTLYPYFEKQEETWIEKTISWEEYVMPPTPVPAPKDFTLPPESEDTTSISTTISNFILSYDTPRETIPELQDGEEVSVEASVSQLSDDIYHDVEISYNVLPQSADTAPDKLNIEFTFNNLPTSDPKMYTTPLIFDVTPSLKFGMDTHTFTKIEGITINFSDPWDAPKFEFSKSETEQVTFKTEPGSKQYIVKHDDIDQHFTISRPMDNREKLEINALDKNGKIIDNLLVEPIITDNGDGTADIDVAISFNEIQGIFEEHKVDFKLEFVTTFEGSGREARKIIDNPFELVYIPEDREPYNMVMNDVIILDGNLGTSNISVQIENKAYPYFQSTDYLTVRNLTREECEEQGSADDAPIYFTTPHEMIENEIIGQSPRIALQGKDAAKENLGFKIQFLDQDNIPTEITAYKETLQFDFWNGDPDDESAQAKVITTITRDITFVFSPKEWKNYTTADWAQYRSIIISMTANEGTEPGGQPVQKLGTAWVLSNISEEEQYYITSYDIKKDYLELSDTSKYSNFQFGYSNMGAAKQYVANDSTKYIMVNNNINDESISSTTTDLLISKNNGVEWVDESGAVGERLYWDMTSQGYGLCAPNLAIFKLKPNERGPEDDLKYEQTFKFRLPVLNEWAESEGLDPLHKDPTQNGGQVSSLFEHVPDDFSRNGFSYGYTGGFKSKEVTLGTGQNERTARLVYWTDYTMKAQIGQLAYLSPTMYDNCEGYRDKMFMVGDPQEQVYHMCGAFTMTLSSFSKSSYYDDAGRGAMMLLRKYAPDGKSLETPVIAGINWNGGSNWNWPGNITPYFDVWQYGGQQQLNLLAYYQNPQLRQP